MDREQLKGWLDRGLSLEQIGHLVGRHPSTVGHWVKKYGLTPNGQAKHGSRGGLTREQLEPLVAQGLPIAEIARRLDRSEPTVRYWIGRYELPRPRNMRRAEVERLLAQGTRTVIRRCRRHGETEFALVGSEGRPRCKRCRAEAVARRRKKVKRLLVDEAGGQCVLCGYSRCLNALEFHHLDPATKEFGVAARGVTRAIADIRAEIEKCVLLCANCHAEVEAGEATLS